MNYKFFFGGIGISTIGLLGMIMSFITLDRLNEIKSWLILYHPQELCESLISPSLYYFMWGINIISIVSMIVGIILFCSELTELKD